MKCVYIVSIYAKTYFSAEVHRMFLLIMYLSIKSIINTIFLLLRFLLFRKIAFLLDRSEFLNLRYIFLIFLKQNEYLCALTISYIRQEKSAFLFSV